MGAGTVLVPLDGSPLAEAALPYAEAIARATGAPVALLSVLEAAPVRAVAVRGTPEMQAEVEQFARGLEEEYLVDAADALRDRGLDASARIAVGEPADRILAAAGELDAALVVMATHGRGGAARWLIGSVADKVMRLSTRPVLLVRPPEQAGEAMKVEIRQIVVPLDGSPLAEAALPLAVKLARAAGATLTLLRVEAPAYNLMPAYEGAGYAFNYSQLDDRVAAAAREYLEGVREGLPSDLQVEIMLLRGMPGRTLVDVLAGDSVDLVVMSTHGWGGLRRLALGSTADRLVRAGVPALLVRPAPATEEQPPQAPAPAGVE